MREKICGGLPAKDCGVSAKVLGLPAFSPAFSCAVRMEPNCEDHELSRRVAVELLRDRLTGEERADEEVDVGDGIGGGGEEAGIRRGPVIGSSSKTTTRLALPALRCGGT